MPQWHTARQLLHKHQHELQRLSDTSYLRVKYHYTPGSEIEHFFYRNNPINTVIHVAIYLLQPDTAVVCIMKCVVLEYYSLQFRVVMFFFIAPPFLWNLTVLLSYYTLLLVFNV